MRTEQSPPDHPRTQTQPPPTHAPRPEHRLRHAFGAGSVAFWQSAPVKPAAQTQAPPRQTPRPAQSDGHDSSQNLPDAPTAHSQRPPRQTPRPEQWCEHGTASASDASAAATVASATAGDGSDSAVERAGGAISSCRKEAAAAAEPRSHACDDAAAPMPSCGALGVSQV